VHRDGIVIFVNPAAVKLFGATSADELVGRSAVDMMLPESRDLVQARIQTLAGGAARVPQTEIRMRRLDGTIMDLEVESTVVEFDGAPAIQVTGRDITERKAAAAALRESEGKLRGLYELSPVGIALTDMAGRYVEFNEAFRRISGYSTEELKALDYWTLTPKRYEAAEALQLEQLARTGHYGPYEKEYLRKDGTLVPLQLNGMLLTGVGGQQFIWSLVEDITERKATERATARERARLETILRTSSDGMHLLDASGLLVEANDAFLHMLGYDRSAVGHLRVLDWDAGDTAAGIERRMSQVMSGSGVVVFETQHRHRDGHVFPVEISVCGIELDGTRLAYASSRDITARKRAEADLALRSAALDVAANVIVITDGAGVIEWANHAFATVTGYAVEEAVGRTPGDLLKSGRHDRAFYQQLWNTISTGHVWHGEIVNRHKDGSLFDEEMTITPLADASGKIAHFIAVKQDITRRKLLEEQFRQVQKMESVGRLAGGVAHDFNNMLGVILGHTELALRQLNHTQPLHGDLVEIQQAAERSTALTRQLLTFARREVVVPQSVDLNETVTNALRMLRRMIGEDIDVKWRPHTRLWPVFVDPTQIDQILTNLCVNARDAIVDVGTITLATANVIVDADHAAVRDGAPPGDYVRLTVRDDGAGMSADTLAHIFEPFYTTKGIGEGTGLGLATVYGAVKQNGGAITVSSAPGEGATFEIYLPRQVGSAQSAEVDHAPAPAMRGGETILLVDDEPALLKLTKRMLEAQGYTVLRAGSPAEAIRLADAHGGAIHLLVSDVVMPTMNGQVLATRLQAGRPALRCLFMSGYPAGVIERRGLLDDDVNFLAKPFLIADLAAKVRAVLDGE
jgi:PAS domain S-box-containing protein